MYDPLSCRIIYCAHNKLRETRNNTKDDLMRAVSLIGFSNMKGKVSFVTVSVLPIVQHESQRCAVNKCEHAESPPLNLIPMFKTYAANKPSMYYITKTNVNKAGWYPHADWPFETEYSSSVNDSVTCCRLGAE